jgi:hypothetical protein
LGLTQRAVCEYGCTRGLYARVQAQTKDILGGSTAGIKPARTITITFMNEALPDRLSIDPNSPYYNETLIVRGVRIRFNGIERTNVEEYCVSEGWIRVAAGKSRDRHGRLLTMKLRGSVEAYVASEPAAESDAPAEVP